MTTYKVVERPGEGLAILVSIYGRQLWAKGKMRVHKSTKCAICEQCVGKFAYRPITNLSNRMNRICIPCIEKSTMNGDNL